VTGDPALRTDGPRLVPAVERGTRILDIVAAAQKAPTAAAIARQLGVPRSSVHGLCATLVELNLLIKNQDQTYQLGPHIMRWANAFGRNSDVAAEFANIWDEGTELPGATITLSIIEGTEVIYIAARNSDALPSFNFRIGMHLPAPFTATGKSFLSYLGDAEVERLFDGNFPAPLTRNSVKSLRDLLDELAACRSQGYSIDDQQVSEGMMCFAASVLNSRNRPIAGVAVSLPKAEYRAEEQARFIRNVKDIAEKISRRLGAEI
jgi:IclR family transcriptional regulator, blcABC operon repressor